MQSVDMLFAYLIGGFGAWAAALMMLVAVQGDRLHRGVLSRCALGFALLLPGGMAPGVDDRARVAEGPLQPSAPIDEADRVRTVQAIDRALQAGYDRNASDEELEPLWQARRALVHADAGPAASKG